MEFTEKLMSKAAEQLMLQRFIKLLYIDLTADRMFVLKTDENDYFRNKTGPLYANDLAIGFLNTPRCHENDRARVSQFLSTENLMKAFEGEKPEVLFTNYRRKNRPSDKDYSYAAMELIPEIDENGHKCVFVLVRDLSSDFRRYRRDIARFEQEKSHVRDLFAGRRTVLVIQSNDTDRQLLSGLLAHEYHTIQAKDGLEGMAVLQEKYRDISLVLADVQLPGLDGYELLQEISSDPILRTIPVVVTTGSNSYGDEERCLKLGAADFIYRPFNPNVVLSRIGGIIKLRESAATLAAVEFDELTGLYTKQAFYHHAGLLLKRYPDRSYSLLISDIEDFKIINDRYGVQVGDNLLKDIAVFLKGAADFGILVGRYDRDQFVSLMPYDSETISIHQLTDSYDRIMSRCPVPGVSGKFGIYDNVDHDLPVSVLCDRAILALETVKHHYGKLYARYDTTLQEKLNRQQRVESGMLAALARGEFKVFYQPKHDTHTGALIGAEALVRWEHPDYGFMSPGEFVPLFERNGFIAEMDFHIWEKTCADLRSWMDAGIPVIPVSVNTSKLDFERPEFMETICGSAAGYGIPHSLLHIEVTESLFSTNSDSLVELLRQCRDRGFSIELDDFGSGYSSLNTLGTLPLDVVKLDMSLMKEIRDPRRSRVMIACTNLAKALELKTVAEGVESREQLMLLREMGADAVQGYYYSAPLPAKEFAEYLKKNLQ